MVIEYILGIDIKAFVEVHRLPLGYQAKYKCKIYQLDKVKMILEACKHSDVQTKNI